MHRTALSQRKQGQFSEQEQLQICTRIHILFWIKLPTAEDFKKAPGCLSRRASATECVTSSLHVAGESQVRGKSWAQSWGLRLCMEVEEEYFYPFHFGWCTDCVIPSGRGQAPIMRINNIFRLSHHLPSWYAPNSSGFLMLAPFITY